MYVIQWCIDACLHWWYRQNRMPILNRFHQSNLPTIVLGFIERFTAAGGSRIIGMLMMTWMYGAILNLYRQKQEIIIYEIIKLRIQHVMHKIAPQATFVVNRQKNATAFRLFRRWSFSVFFRFSLSISLSPFLSLYILLSLPCILYTPKLDTNEQKLTVKCINNNKKQQNFTQRNKNTCIFSRRSINISIQHENECGKLFVYWWIRLYVEDT